MIPPDFQPETCTAEPLIFDIHRFALDDGPGIRTTVFLKGCPISCMWCQNPESIRQEAEIAFRPLLCIHCGHCENFCPENAARMDYPGRIIRERCGACGVCAEKCPSTALKIVGKHYTGKELVKELLKDRIFYETSCGGVTFSGGEPALHMDYLSKVMGELKQNSIHIAIQTSGFFDMEEFRRKLLPFIDLIFYDIKLFNTRKHREYTGVGNERILDNFISLADDQKEIIVPRTPLVPSITATKENLEQIANFVRAAGCENYELLPYNPGGVSKILTIGKPPPSSLSRGVMKIKKEKRRKDTIRQEGSL